MMNILAWYTRFHWHLFNALTRVFGIIVALTSIRSLAVGAYYGLYPSAAEGIETLGLPASLLYILVGILGGIIGVSVLRVRPYRPDLGDAAWTFKLKSSSEGIPELRSWWTGEPKIPRQRSR